MAKFTPAELEVMRVLWRGEAMKPAEIQDAAPREIGNSALRSVLAILVDKGHVTRELRGKAYHYSSVVPRESAMRSMLREVAGVFTGGSMEALVCQLIRDEQLTEDELRRLRRLANDDAEEEGGDECD